MNIFWKVAAVFVGFVLMFFAVWFIPRNLGRVIRHAKEKGWTRRRIINALSWAGIIFGYFSAGWFLVRLGWRNYYSWFSFAMAMFLFIPVPCHIRQLNDDSQQRYMRKLLFIAAGFLCIFGPMILGALGIWE